MDYKELKETKFYGNLAKQMKVAYAILFKDPESDGLEISEIEALMQGELSGEEVSIALDMLSDKSEIESGYEKRGRRHVQVYKLNSSFAWATKEIAELLGHDNQQ